MEKNYIYRVNQLFIHFKSLIEMGWGGHKKRTLGSELLRNTPLYIVFSGMKSRCYNTKAANYKYYGAKGIRVCNEWLDDFMVFYKWAIGNGWKEGLTIDRFPDQSGDYSPNNCRIATKKQQSNNRSFDNVVNNFKNINDQRRAAKLK